MKALETALRRTVWPDRDRWLAYMKFMALFYVVFFPVYFVSGQFAASSGRAIEFAMSWEKAIPFVPWMIWPYLSLFSLFPLPLFHMTFREMSALSRQSSLSLMIAAAIFVLLPGKLGFQHAPVAGLLKPVFDAIAAVDTPHNLAPSLHVVFATLILLGCAERASRRLAWVYRLWLASMSVSTMLVHQHHLLDVATGLGLAVAARRVSPTLSGALALREPARRETGKETDGGSAEAGPDDAFLDRRDHRIV